LVGKEANDSSRAIDLIKELPRADSSIGVLHLSMGGTRRNIPGLPSWVLDSSVTCNFDHTLFGYISFVGKDMKVKESARTDEVIILGSGGETLGWIGMEAPDSLDGPAAQRGVIYAVGECAANLSNILGKKSLREFCRSIILAKVLDI
jgi:hypothetical protein